MNTKETLQQMQQLKFHGMQASYSMQLELPIHQQLEAHELIAQLIQAELLCRTNERTAYYLRLAKLRLPAVAEQVACSAARNFTKQQLATLLEGHYLRQGENILITGATGCGKSYLACALGHQACIQGYRTTYLNMNRLIEKITLSKLDGTYIKYLNYLERQTLIILDDFGLQSLNQDVKLALLQILVSCHIYYDVYFFVPCTKKIMTTYKVTLTQAEREELLSITKGGVHTSKKVIHSLILLNCDEGEFADKVNNEDVAKVLKIGLRTIDRLKKKFVEEGYEAAMENRPTSRIYDRKADGDVEAHLVALSCSKAPEGFARWSLRLLAEKMVELQYVDDISYETVRRVLKKTNLSPGK